MKKKFILNKDIENFDRDRRYKIMEVEGVELRIKFLESGFLEDSDNESRAVEYSYDIYEFLKNNEIASFEHELNLSLIDDGIIFDFKPEITDYLINEPLKIIDNLDEIAEKISSYIEMYSLFDNTEKEVTFEISFVR